MQSTTGIATAALLICLPIFDSHAQSKEETSSFISKKANVEWARNKNWPGEQKSSQQIVFSGEHCTMTLHLYYSPEDGVPAKLYKHVANLEELDPTETEASGTLTFIYVRERKELISVQTCILRPSVSCGEITPDHKDFLDIATTNSSNAEKLARAFSHLIALCGGKGELF